MVIGTASKTMMPPLTTKPMQEPAQTAPSTTRKARRPWRWLPYGGIALLVVLIIAGLWPKPVPVEITRVTVGPMQVTVNEEGKTRIRQRYVISAPVSGQLRRIPFKAGAVVKVGEPVVAVEPGLPTLLDIRAHNLAEARRDSAAANLEKARTAHAFSATELRRFEKLYADKTVSVNELEGYQLRETSAAKDVAAAEGTLRQAEAELAEFTQPDQIGTNAPDPLREVPSPVSGKVLRILEENARTI